MANRIGCSDYSRRSGNFPSLRQVCLTIICGFFISWVCNGCKLEKTTGPSNTAPPDSTDTLIVTRIAIPAANGTHLNTVSIFGSTIYIGGINGLLLQGTPTLFSPINLPIQNSIWNINSANGTILAFASGGNILHSNNGLQWTIVAQLSNYQLQSSAIDGLDRMWVVGDNSPLFYALAPSYNNWSEYGRIGNVSSFNSIGFHPASGHGITTSNLNLYRTTNNGLQWTIAGTIDASVNNILFHDSSEVLMACNNGLILRTTDFGINWNHVNMPSDSVERINRIIRISDHMFIAVSNYFGGSNRRGRVWHSHDKQNWTLTTDILYEVRDIVYDTQLGIFICGTDGYFAKLTTR